MIQTGTSNQGSAGQPAAKVTTVQGTEFGTAQQVNLDSDQIGELKDAISELNHNLLLLIELLDKKRN